MDFSPLQSARFAYAPKLPAILRGSIDKVSALKGSPAEPAADKDRLKAAFPRTYGLPSVTLGAGDNPGIRKAMKIGVILSGGPAPGGHNVVAGIFDGLKAANPASELFGFRGGPGGLVDDKCMDITAELVDQYRNTGGFDLIGSGRTKIETPEQFEKALETAKRRKLDAVVVVGGDDSNTNAAVLVNPENVFEISRALQRALSAHATLDALESAADWPALRGRLDALLGDVRRAEPAHAAAGSGAAGTVRVVQWNIEHGNWYDQVERALVGHPALAGADVLTLDEADLGCARAGNRDVAADLAQALGLHAAWAPMFLETTAGRSDDPLLEAGRENDEGLFGVAVMSRWPIGGTRIVDLLTGEQLPRIC